MPRRSKLCAAGACPLRTVDVQNSISFDLRRGAFMTDCASAFLDGDFIDTKEAGILQVHALHYASSVFEGVRAYNGRAFMLGAHVSRLLRSAEIVGLRCDLDEARCTETIEETIARSGLKDSYIRPLIFNGGPDLGVFAPTNSTRFGVLVWDWSNLFGDAGTREGISLTTRVPYRRPPESCFPSEAKASAGYLAGCINRHHAATAGFDDALMLTHDGFVAEASGANIFALWAGTLLTPRPKGILNGITRQVVINHLPPDLCFEERDIDPATLKNADEVFLTGTAYEIMPVRRIDDVAFAPGPLTRRIAENYRSLTSSPPARLETPDERAA